MPTQDGTANYDQPATMLLLPAFLLIENVTPLTVPTVIGTIIEKSPTTTTPSDETFRYPPSVSPPPKHKDLPVIATRPSPHDVVILLCSQRTRDVRCGQSAPLLKKEFERHLRPRGLYRDMDDERPGGVGIYFISHVGGHKYSANVIVYRRVGAFGEKVVGTSGVAQNEVEARKAAVVDEAGEGPRKAEGEMGEEEGKVEINGKQDADGKKEEAAKEDKRHEEKGVEGSAPDAKDGDEVNRVDAKDNEVVAEMHHQPTAPGGQGDPGAGQCIWLARIMPSDCENIIRYTVLQGKVLKPETQLRGGFDRCRGVMSW